MLFFNEFSFLPDGLAPITRGILDNLSKKGYRVDLHPVALSRVKDGSDSLIQITYGGLRVEIYAERTRGIDAEKEHNLDILTLLLYNNRNHSLIVLNPKTLGRGYKGFPPIAVDSYNAEVELTKLIRKHSPRDLVDYLQNNIGSISTRNIAFMFSNTSSAYISNVSDACQAIIDNGYLVEDDGVDLVQEAVKGNFSCDIGTARKLMAQARKF